MLSNKSNRFYMSLTDCPHYSLYNELMLYNAVTRSALTKRPRNVVVEADTNVILECSSNKSASSIRWTYDGDSATDQCSPTNPRFTTTSNGDDCLLTALGNYSVQGPYTCRDTSGGKTAQAVVIVIGNPKLNISKDALMSYDGNSVWHFLVRCTVRCLIWTGEKLSFNGLNKMLCG